MLRKGQLVLLGGSSKSSHQQKRMKMAVSPLELRQHLSREFGCLFHPSRDFECGNYSWLFPELHIALHPSLVSQAGDEAEYKG